MEAQFKKKRLRPDGTEEVRIELDEIMTDESQSDKAGMNKNRYQTDDDPNSYLDSITETDSSLSDNEEKQERKDYVGKLSDGHPNPGSMKHNSYQENLRKFSVEEQKRKKKSAGAGGEGRSHETDHMLGGSFEAFQNSFDAGTTKSNKSKNTTVKNKLVK